MNKSDRNDRMLFVKAQQRIHDGKVQICPRCGLAGIRAVLSDNPEAQSFPKIKIRICKACAYQEESNCATHGEDDFSVWAALTDPGFKVEPAPGAPIQMSALTNGTEAWAWSYTWSNYDRLPLSSAKPTKGMLCDMPREIGDPKKMPAFFVPYQKGTKKLAPTKAVRVEAVNLHSNQEDAEEAYDKAVYAVYRRFMDTASLVHSDMLDPGRFN